MTKFGRIFLAVLIAAAAAPAQDVSFKLLGGLAFIQGDDYNAGADGALQLLRTTATGVIGDFGRFGAGPGFQVEIMTHWSRRIAIGLGGGLYEVRADGRVTGQSVVAGVPASIVTSLKPKISVIPFALNVYFKNKIGSRSSLDVFAGPMFNVAMLTSNRETTMTPGPNAETESYRASQVALGAQAGLSASLGLGRGIALVVEGAYRAGKVSDFSGNWALSTTSTAGTVTKSSAESYYWLYRSGQDSSTLTGFFDNPGPSGAGISGVRKAEINLSGVILSAGLKFTF